MDINYCFQLNNGVEIPALGLGVFLSTPGYETEQAVLWALEAGYRHIDTAAFYKNEADVGAAVRASGINRRDVFITTKLWNTDHGFDAAMRAFDNSLKLLKSDYIDLYLIHWPVQNLRKDSWRALEKIYDMGLARSIGVSNYTIRHLEEMRGYADIGPAVNQVEFHPFLYQKELLEYCMDNGIYLEAYSPLVRGKKFGDPTIIDIAGKYGKSEAQVMLRWALQLEMVILPKSVKKHRIIENADIYDFELSGEDMERLNALNLDYRIAWNPTDMP